MAVPLITPPAAPTSTVAHRAVPTPGYWPQPCSDCPLEPDPWQPQAATHLVAWSAPGTGHTHREPACADHLDDLVAFWQSMRHHRVHVETPDGAR